MTMAIITAVLCFAQADIAGQAAGVAGSEVNYCKKSSRPNNYYPYWRVSAEDATLDSATRICETVRQVFFL